jgi:putative endonuclease
MAVSQTRGVLGEDLVSAWLLGNDAQILYRRWRCRGGEVDTIALHDGFLAFVEVKTRGSYNWDANGLLAVNNAKQSTLYRAAEIFLSQHPEYANYPCRFDVAIVRHLSSRTKPPANYLSIQRHLDTGDIFVLLDYLPAAF